MDVTEEELRLLVTAEVDKAIKDMTRLDKQTKTSADEFKLLGKTISSAFVLKEIVDFGKDSVKSFEDSKQTLNLLNQTVKTTGATAWTSTYALKEMASDFQDLTNYSDDSIESMQSVLLGFKNIKGDNFKAATKEILNMSAVMKIDFSSAAQTVGKALDDPINGLDSLKRQGFNFTDAQKALIKQMLAVGDTAGAQKVILDELESTYGGAAEAARTSFTGIKNNLGDIEKGFGKVILKITEGSGVLDLFGKAVAYVADAFKESDENIAKLFGGSKYREWYDSLADEQKIKEATNQLALWQKKLAEYQKQAAELEKMGDVLAPGTKAEMQQNLDTALRSVDAWRKAAAIAKDSLDTQQKTQQAENDRVEAEGKINDLMLSISTEYTKLGKDDPVIQLKNYQKQLDEIAKNRKTLQTTKIGIDTADAEKELDYMEKAVRQKMAALRTGEKQSWQQWLSEILKVDQKYFTTGKEAAALYLKGLGNAMDSSGKLKEIFGKDFDIAAFLGEQEDNVKQKITDLLKIDPSKIDETFKVEDQSIQELIDKYFELKKAKGEAYGDQQITELQKNIADYGKSEKDLYLAQLQTNGATETQIEQAGRLYDEYEKLKASSSWTDTMTLNLEKLIDKWTELDSKSTKILANLGTSLANVSFDAALSGLETFGEALGKGQSASESLQAALADMAQRILDSLPTMFLQAGLQLIAGGQWQLGLGFIAAAGTTAVIDGITKGATSSDSDTTANALGGVYDKNGVVAFSHGDAFTNTIVQSPTFFRFATGSDFANGVMGEAGPEAVMPLTRSADGSLGVRVQGTSGDGSTQMSVACIINIYNNTDAEVKATESTNQSGQKQVDIFIGYMNKAVSTGRLDRSLTARFKGLSVQGV